MIEKPSRSTAGDQPSYRWDVACVSYLAPAQLLMVESFPTPNFGAEVIGSEYSLAADGPMVAMTLTRMGFTSALLANSLAGDPEGCAVMRHMNSSGVSFLSTTSAARSTSPKVFIISNRSGDRTWFPYLPDVEAELRAADHSQLTLARIVYIDCYTVLRPAVDQILATLVGTGNQVFLNLGGCELDDRLVNTLAHCTVLAVQTNVAEDQAHRAEAVADMLHAALHAGLTVVTMGAAGAIMRSSSHRLWVPAYSVTPVRVHGAGALFSAGLIASLLEGRSIGDALLYASACAAYQCVRSSQIDWPSRAEIDRFLSSHFPIPHIG